MKGRTRIIAKFHTTDLVICCHSRESKTLSYSRINTVSINILRVKYNLCHIDEWMLFQLLIGKIMLFELKQTKAIFNVKFLKIKTPKLNTSIVIKVQQLVFFFNNPRMC